MRKRQQKIGQCIYCGNTRPLTDDHIPPANLFTKPRPNNLIKVPSCFPCNNGSSKDDEDFRLKIAIREDIADHPAAKLILPSVLRSLSKPNKKGFTKALVDSMREFECMTPAGLYIGKGATYDVNNDRINSVATRIIKGLFYHHKHIRIPEKYMAISYSMSSFPPERIDNDIKSFLSAYAFLTKAPSITIGDNVFSYWYRFLDDDEHSSMWVFRFFERVDFIGATCLKTR